MGRRPKRDTGVFGDDVASDFVSDNGARVVVVSARRLRRDGVFTELGAPPSSEGRARRDGVLRLEVMVVVVPGSRDSFDAVFRVDVALVSAPGRRRSDGAFRRLLPLRGEAAPEAAVVERAARRGRGEGRRDGLCAISAETQSWAALVLVLLWRWADAGGTIAIKYGVGIGR